MLRLYGALTACYFPVTLLRWPHYTHRRVRISMRSRRLVAVLCGVQPNTLILIGRDGAGTLTTDKVLITAVPMPSHMRV